MGFLKVVVTGASGNLGSNIINQCKELGVDCIAITRDNINSLKEIMTTCDVIIHAAGDILSSYKTNLVGYTHSNLQLTAQILDDARAMKVKRFFYISSCAIYGNASSTSEKDSFYQPLTLNGKFKMLNEDLVREFCKAHDIQSTSFRLFNLYGGNDRFSILSHLKRCCRSNEVFQLRNNGQSRRDFIHVKDVAELISKSLFQQNLPQALNLGTGKTVGISEVVSKFMEIYPSLKIELSSLNEVEYSRADIRLLNEVFGEFKFRNIIEDIPKLT